MKWQLTFEKVSTEGDIKDKVVEKFSGLETYMGRMKDRVENGYVVLSKGDRWGYRVKVEFRLPGHDIVASGEGESLLTAIDDSYEKAAREVKGYLEKVKEQRKHV